MSEDEKSIYYSIGYRDAIAGVLANNKDKIKLKDLAFWYESHYERHFSHNWHVS